MSAHCQFHLPKQWPKIRNSTVHLSLHFLRAYINEYSDTNQIQKKTTLSSAKTENSVDEILRSIILMALIHSKTNDDTNQLFHNINGNTS